MRLATILDGRNMRVALIEGARLLPLANSDPGFASIRAIAASGADGLRRVRDWAAAQPAAAWRSIGGEEFGPAVPDPGAIFTIGLNYRSPGEARSSDADTAAKDATQQDAPARPLVYAKLPTSVGAHGATLVWDRALTPNVDAEVELGVVIGVAAVGVDRIGVDSRDAMSHVFGYTIVDDISSRDPWLDGDQWLLGKSMAGFCPVGPWIVTVDEISPDDLRLGCTINGVAIQDGTTADMRRSIADIIAYLGRHTDLRPGDLIATGTPPRLTTPPGPDRHLEPGDTVTAWIAGIGELTTTIA